MNTTICGRPLTFGDVEQIAHINALQSKEREKEEQQRRIAAGETIEYEVTMKVEGIQVVTVEACSEEDAMNIAKSELDLWEIEDLEIIEIEDCRVV